MSKLVARKDKRKSRLWARVDKRLKYCNGKRRTRARHGRQWANERKRGVGKLTASSGGAERRGAAGKTDPATGTLADLRRTTLARKIAMSRSRRTHVTTQPRQRQPEIAVSLWVPLEAVEKGLCIAVHAPDCRADRLPGAGHVSHLEEAAAAAADKRVSIRGEIPALGLQLCGAMPHEIDQPDKRVGRGTRRGREGGLR